MAEQYHLTEESNVSVFRGAGGERDRGRRRRAGHLVSGRGSGGVPAVDAFSSYWQRYGGSGKAMLPALVEGCRALARARTNYADKVERPAARSTSISGPTAACYSSAAR